MKKVKAREQFNMIIGHVFCINCLFSRRILQCLVDANRSDSGQNHGGTKPRSVFIDSDLDMDLPYPTQNLFVVCGSA